MYSENMYVSSAPQLVAPAAKTAARAYYQRKGAHASFCKTPVLVMPRLSKDSFTLLGSCQMQGSSGSKVPPSASQALMLAGKRLRSSCSCLCDRRRQVVHPFVKRNPEIICPKVYSVLRQEGPVSSRTAMSSMQEWLGQHILQNYPHFS